MKITRATGVLSAVGIMLSNAGIAGDVRHRNIPTPLLGTWAPHADECKADKSIIVLSADGYARADGKCTVEWVTETAGRSGPIYSAHMICGATADKSERRIVNVILLPKSADQISMGSEFSSLKTFQRCPME